MSTLLLLCIAAVAVFALVSWHRLMVLLDADAAERKAQDEWWAERERYRQRFRDSSLADDSESLRQAKADNGRPAA